MKMFKLKLPAPIKLNIDQINDLSEKAFIITNEELGVEEIASNNLFELSTAVDMLYVYMEDLDYFNSKGEFLGA